MTLPEVMAELKSFGNENTKKLFLNHGAKEPFYGVKVGDMKKIVKKIKKDHKLSLQLYETGNSDAMYLAGLIADENIISKKELQKWAENAYWYMISEYTVAWVASESPHGIELAEEWIHSDQERLAAAGWSTYANIATIKDNSELNMDRFSQLLTHVEENIHQAQNRVRYTMNNFVIAVGAYISELNLNAKEVAEKIGKVDVNVGNTSCKVPLAKDYILKAEQRGSLEKKRKMARC